MDKVDLNQNLSPMKSGNIRDFSSMFSQHEALRRATLLKHRKVSTQLKLDMVQRQLSDLRRSATDNDRHFYRLQMAELSTELKDLGTTLDKVERNAFYTRRRLLRHSGLDTVCSSGSGVIPLSSSHPTICASTENLSRGTSGNSLKNRVCHLMSSPTNRFKERHFLGELRAAASLSSLNIKSPSNADEYNSSKETKSWKAPLRFLGSLVDSRFRRKLWGSTKRTKSADNILEDNKSRRLMSSDCDNKDYSETSVDNVFDSPSSSSEDEDIEEEEEDMRNRNVTATRVTWKTPVGRKKMSNSQRAQIDPALLAEIEDFEKMAERYIKQHS